MNTMVFAGHQPNFMPNLAFFSKMKHADLFVITTNIQLERREGWQVRNKIMTHQGESWLTVPVHGKNKAMTKDVKICNTDNWRNRHYKILYYTYKKRDGFENLSMFEDIYNKEWTQLVDLNIEIIKRFCEILNIDTKIVVDEDSYGPKQRRFIDMGKKYSADAYLSGRGAHLYLSDEEIKDVEKSGIRFLVHEHNLSDYPYSTIHYLLTNGRKWVQDVI